MTAVKRNISTIILQQARKVHLDAAAHELHLAAQGAQPLRSKRLPPTLADEALLVQNLEATRIPGRLYGVRAEYGPSDVPPAAPHPKDTPREAAVVQMSDLMRYGTQQMEGYEMHCEVVRRETRARVAKEVAEEMARKFEVNGGESRGKTVPVAAVESRDGDDVPMDLD
jgi:hypothetical protein